MSAPRVLVMLLGLANPFPMLTAGADEDKWPPAPATLMYKEMNTALRQRVDEIKFDALPLPQALQRIRDEYRIPLVIDDSVAKLSPMPKISLTVRDVTVRQLLELVGTCTSTSQWLDPPVFAYNTPLKIYCVTKYRGLLLADQYQWKTFTIHQPQRVIAALSEPSEPTFQDTPLQDALSNLSDGHAVRIEYEGPEDLKVRPVNFDVEKLRLRDVLSIILKPVNLTYVAEQQTLRIVTIEEAEKCAVTRVYSVPPKTAGQADGRVIEAAIVKLFAEPGHKVPPHVAWMGNCVAVTATEGQQARVEEFITEFRQLDEILKAQEVVPHPPGKLPGE